MILNIVSQLNVPLDVQEAKSRLNEDFLQNGKLRRRVPSFGMLLRQPAEFSITFPRGLVPVVLRERPVKPLISKTVQSFLDHSFRDLFSLDKIPDHLLARSARIERTAKRANVIIAAGPGGLTFNHGMIDKLTTTLKQSEGLTVKSIIAVGNGEKGISIESIIEAVKQAKQKSRPITLFLQSHGRIFYGEHQIRLGENEWSSSRELFRKLKSVLGDNYPLSIFVTACHGGAAACAAMNELPTGSVFVALGRRTDYVMGFDIDRFASSIDLIPWNSSEKLLYHYLTKSLKNRITPVVAYAKKGFLDLGNLLVGQVGRSFSVKQQLRAHRKIDEFIGKDYVDKLMKQIQNARSEYDIFAVDYGPALAVVFAGIENRD